VPPDTTGDSMAELLGWLRNRLRADRALALLAIPLLGGDALLVWLHIQRFLLRRLGMADHWLAADRLGLDDTAGMVVVWVGVQVLIIAVAAALVAVRRPSLAILIASALVIAVTAVKLMKPHLALGEVLAVRLHLHGWLGLNGRQLGKLVAEIGIGLAWLLVASIAARLAADGAARTAAALALWLVVGLAVAGGLSDLGYMIFAGRFNGAVALFALAEGGGEMLILSLGSLGFVALARILERHRRMRRKPVAAIASATGDPPAPPLPGGTSWC
jgi:hypothetical protein